MVFRDRTAEQGNQRPVRRIGRRAFLSGGTLVLGSAAWPGGRVLAAETESPVLRVGLMTDLHYAEKPTWGSRHYRQSLAKIKEAVRKLNDRRVDLAVELGDLIDGGSEREEELAFLRTVDEQFARCEAERHYVLGNHCLAGFTKEEFIAQSGARRPHYGFDRAGYHFVILDACYRQDGEPYGRNNFEWTDTIIPPHELDWLEEDLAKSDRPTIVFVHQRLDVEGSYAVKNAPAVRKVLEKSGQVRAVLQGHYHRNDHKEIGGIHYCTLAAMVEGAGETNNAYAVMNLHADGTIRIDGFRQQSDYTWRG